MAENETKPLRLLSLDGGGIRGMSALLIVREFMQRIQYKENLDFTPAPHVYFDMIGGTGTGGIIALLLGRLRMPIDDAIRAYDAFVKDAFVDGRKRWGEEMFRADALKKTIRNIVGAHSGGDKDVRMIDGADCKVFVCANYHDNMTPGRPSLLRTYKVPNNAGPNCMIWEAARATTAHPGHYKPITIADGAAYHDFIDAGMGLNNPCRVLLDEAASVYPTRSLGVVVSIGTGRAQTIGIPAGRVRAAKVLSPDLLGVLRDVAADCERVAGEQEKLFLNYPELYFRFSVMHGMQDVSWDAWDRQSEVAAHTAQYLQGADVDSRVDVCVRALLSGRGQIQMSSVAHIPAQLERAGRIKGIPPPSVNFTGRSDVLIQMKGYFSTPVESAVQQHIFVLHGPGGAGKTQIACKFIYGCQHDKDVESVNNYEILCG